jgi:tetratricopeptide (TPR) repeat protein
MENDPRAAACFEQAFALHRDNDLERARVLYERALDYDPEHFRSLHSLGVLLLQQQQPERALPLIQRAIRLNPQSPGAYLSRGNAEEQLNDFDSAVRSFEQAIAAKPDFADAHFNRANVLRRLRKYELAIAGYERTLALKPGHVFALNNCALALSDLKRHSAALERLDRALALDLGYAEAHYNRGNVLLAMEDYRAALASYDACIALDPSRTQAHFNRATALKNLRRLDEALAAYETAIGQQPQFAEAHSNRAIVLQDLNQLEEAVAAWDEAIKLQPENAPLHLHKAMGLLSLGHLEEGWREFEWRLRTDGLETVAPSRTFSRPRWDGRSSIAGKTLLIHSEYGLGDTLQFCRYVPLLAARGAGVVLEVQRPLASLLRRLDGAPRIIHSGDPPPHFDLHCPLLSLPLAFNTALATIPTPRRYLHVDADQVGRWRDKLGVAAKPRVGLVWSGNHLHANDRNRSLPLASLLRMLPDGFDYVSLQREPRDADRLVLGETDRILNLAADIADFSDTAALCECMDLVICVDTSVAHLSAGLGRPTWILLPANADWRWLFKRNDSPWYATATLYRQERAGDWDGVLQRVRSDLAQYRPRGHAGEAQSTAADDALSPQ